MQLSENEVLRYSRQLILRGWGAKEQLQLRSLRVGVSISLPSAALYLAAAGVGQISLLEARPARHDDGSRTLPPVSPDVQPLLAHLRHFNRHGNFQLSPSDGQSTLDYLVLLEDETESAANIYETTALIAVRKTTASYELSIGSLLEPRGTVVLPHSAGGLPLHLLAGTAAAELIIYHQLKSALDLPSKSMSCLC
jgi:hypothetical protein